MLNQDISNNWTKQDLHALQEECKQIIKNDVRIVEDFLFLIVYNKYGTNKT